MKASCPDAVCALIATGLLCLCADLSDAEGLGSDLSSINAADLDEIELQTIEKRKALASGHLTLRVQTTIDVAHPAQTAFTKWHSIVFKGDWIRESRRAVSDSVDQTGQTMVAHGELVRIPARDDGWGQVFQQREGQQSASQVTDPRLLGLAAWYYDSMNQFGYDSGGVLDPNRRHVNVEIAEREGKSLLKVSYEFDAKVGTISCERLLDPEFDFLPVSIDLLFPENPGSGGRLRQSLICELKRYPPDSIPYPARVVFRSQRGDVISSEQVVVVESADFEDVDDSEFSLAALDLQRGRVVDAGGVVMHWDGEKLAPGEVLTEQPLVADDGERGSSRRVSWILLVNAFFLAIIAAAICARSFRVGRNRGQTGSQSGL